MTGTTQSPDPEEFRIGSQRENQYTPMGEVAMVGDFARGVANPSTWRRLTGWRRIVAITGAALLVVFVVMIMFVVVGPAIVNAL